MLFDRLCPLALSISAFVYSVSVLPAFFFVMLFSSSCVRSVLCCAISCVQYGMFLVVFCFLRCCSRSRHVSCYRCRWMSVRYLLFLIVASMSSLLLLGVFCFFCVVGRFVRSLYGFPLACLVSVSVIFVCLFVLWRVAGGSVLTHTVLRILFFIL